MKFALTAAIAAGLAASLAVPSAALADDPIVVKSHQAAVQTFAERLSRDISRNLDGAMRSRTARAGDLYGLTAVTFSIDRQGQIAGVEMARRSGNSMLDSVARQVVRRLDIDQSSLPPSVNRVRAYMIIAPDDDTHEELLAKARGIETERRMASKGSTQELVLTLAPRTRT